VSVEAASAGFHGHVGSQLIRADPLKGFGEAREGVVAVQLSRQNIEFLARGNVLAWHLRGFRPRKSSTTMAPALPSPHPDHMSR
jgi:hypothetical protein